ncbi:MAG: arabinose-5-phosphate isomerase [Deltaproteobacteria bacterium]|nr:MAG: arabinose-5-phosphate isomerase [Deltaproteobacteria bacterium]
MHVLNQARDVLALEARSILELIDRLDAGFESAVDILYQATGPVIVAGIGKSGLIGRKIVATLNSTGTHAVFLHPVEAMHGDLGMVTEASPVLAISNSGETTELTTLIPVLNARGCPVIALTGNPASTLARISTVVIDVGVEKEACPMGLAPTSSTTAQLAMGDALAVALITQKGFTAADFKKVHPGGALGQRLSGAVRDVMITGEKIPLTRLTTPLPDAIRRLDAMKLGSILVQTDTDLLAGIITDGDVRRFLVRNGKIETATAADAMTASPRAVTSDTQLFEALNLMETHQITVLPVIDKHRRPSGILHLHDILGKGAVNFSGAAR